MYKYLFEKHYKHDYDTTTNRKLFNSVDDLLDYMKTDAECLFNGGFSSAEIRLYRIKVEES